MLFAKKTDHMPPAPGQGKMHQQMMMNKGMNCMEDLKLNKAQQKKFDELRIGFEKTQNTIKAEIENLKLDIKTALKAENYSRAKELNKQVYAKKNQLADARIDFVAARMKELTSEQKEILQAQLGGNKMHPKMMKGMHPGMNMQPGMGKGMGKNMKNCDDCEDCGDHGNKEAINAMPSPQVTPQAPKTTPKGNK